jgi:hypothetical protein
MRKNQSELHNGTIEGFYEQQSQHEWESLIRHKTGMESILRDGVSKADSTGRYPEFYFSKPNEIIPFMATVGFNQIDLVTCEGVFGAVEEK